MRIPFVTENTIDVASDVNESLLSTDGLITGRVTGILTEPPPTAVDGQRVAIASGATGIFTGRGGQIGVYTLQGSFWVFHSPVLCVLDNVLYLSHAGTWKVLATAT